MRKVVELKPVREVLSDYDRIEQAIAVFFKREIYLPLIESLKATPTVLKNSSNALVEAIEQGKVTLLMSGLKVILSGEFNAALSKQLLALGAQFKKSKGAFEIDSEKLPIEVQHAALAAAANLRLSVEAVLGTLSTLTPATIADSFSVSHLLDQTMFRVDREFRRNVSKITVVPKLTPDVRKAIADEYNNNLQIYIRDFTEEQTSKLREQVKEHVLDGGRQEGLVKIIKESYQVSQRKAKFLARQETALMMTAFTHSRYQDAGVHEYKWRSVTGTPQHPVRPMHSELNKRSNKGETFRFDNPPVDDPNGARHNPGQNYNCRCVAIPLVRF